MNLVETDVYGWKNAAAEDSHRYLVPAILDELSRIRPSAPQWILDLGCGNGSVSARLAALGHSVVGVDVSKDGIEIAAAAYPEVDFRLASVYDSDLGHAGDGFDVVVSLEVIEHLFHPARLLRQAWSRLKPGGFLL